MGDDGEQLWEVDGIIATRTRRYGRGQPHKKYLIRWKGEGPEEDRWKFKDELMETMAEMIEEFEARQTPTS